MKAEYVEVHATLQSPVPMLRGPQRERADEEILAAFFVAEAKAGYPVSGEQQRRMRELMRLQGSVATVQHVARKRRP
jgi:hypothetical protein